MNSTKNLALPASITTPLQRLEHPLFEQHRITVWIKRDDLNHPQIQGNKWHKLKYNLAAAVQQGKTGLLTFGGAYSNHLAATAYAAQRFGLSSIGLIRGDELADHPEKWSHTLTNAHAHGMQLHFLSRADYRRRHHADFLKALIAQHPHAYLLPEGGSNALALKGVGELMDEIERQLPSWTHLFCAVGTGATLAGLIKHAQPAAFERTLYGVAALTPADSLKPQIQAWIGQKTSLNWQLLHFQQAGAYAKLPPTLAALKEEWETRWQLPLDPVYTVKMVYGLFAQLQQNRLPRGAQVVLLHTGGLQGNTQTSHKVSQ